MGKLEHKTDPLLQSQFLSEDNHKKTAQFYTTVFTLVIFFLLQIVISSGNYSGKYIKIFWDDLIGTKQKAFFISVQTS